MKRMLAALVALLSMCATGMAQNAAADEVCGLYLITSPRNAADKAKVQVERATDGTYQGRIVWVETPNNPDGTPRKDNLNPDPAKRDASVGEVLMCWGLKYKDGKWVKGTLYDPTTGKKYSIQLKMAENGKDVEARYYVGRPILGLTQIWQRL